MVNRSGSTKRRLNETQHRESKTHKMGMQISRGIHPEVSQAKYLRVGETGIGADHPDLAQQKESVVEEGHLMADHVYMLLSIPPKYSVSGGGGVYQGQECHCDRTKVHGSGEELCGTELLGEGLLRVNGGAG